MFGESFQNMMSNNDKKLSNSTSNMLNNSSLDASFNRLSINPYSQVSLGQTVNQDLSKKSNSYTSQNQAVATNQSGLISDSLLSAVSNIPVDVQRVLQNLSNADIRSCHILTEIFNKLKSLTLETPIFLTFTYEIEMNPQSLALKKYQLEQQLQSFSSSVIEKYNSRKQMNPDPSRYYLTPINGFDGLIERCMLQSQYLEKITNALENLNTKQKVVRLHMEVEVMRRIETIRRRYLRLQSSIILVLSSLEDCALKNSHAQLDMPFLRRLQSEINNLYEQFYQSSSGRFQLNQIKSRLVEISESLGISPTLHTYSMQSKDNTTEEKDRTNKDHPLSDKASNNQINKTDIIEFNISDNTARQIKTILQKQESLVESLKLQIKEDSSKAKLLINHMNNKSMNSMANER